MEDEIQKLIRTHKVGSKGRDYCIYLNKPGNLIYDIGDITIEVDSRTFKKTVHCMEIPKDIKDYMESIQKESLAEYVVFLEDNLNEILGGARKSAGNLKSVSYGVAVDDGRGEPSNASDCKEHTYSFPVNNKVTGNLAYKAFKKNILLLALDELFVTVECSKCAAVQNLHSTASRESSPSHCSKCGEKLEVIFVPMVDPDFLGFLSFKRCKFLMMNHLIFYYSCAECEKIHSKGLSIGERCTTVCSGCSRPIALQIDEAEYIERARGHRIEVGKPLPRNGTCEHYKKSQRWLRFPCCNGLYPCDICHDMSTNHKCVLANKMVCGLCSKEQSVNSTCSCGMSTKNRASQFWEGGKGNRNKATMSRKDDKKYKRP